MSDPEKKSGGSGSMVVVEKTASSRHKPYRPTELQEEPAPDLHKRSKAPAVPSVTEELKDTTVIETSDIIKRKELDRAVSSEKHSHVSKKLSSNKRRGSPPEEIATVLMDATKDLPTIHPIPARVDTVASEDSSLKSAGKTENKADNESITDEVAELPTTETAKGHSEWSDDEEAGGLPRSESRASRVSRAMRQLFCCGVAYNAPSEEDIPPREYSGI